MSLTTWDSYSKIEYAIHNDTRGCPTDEKSLHMSHKEWEPASIFDLFGDSLARCILVMTRQEPRSAEELAAELDVSLPTVYRRTNKLIEFDLLTDHLRADESKNQYKVFEATLERIVFEIDEDGYRVELETGSHAGEQFEAFWTELGRSAPDDVVTDHTEKHHEVDWSGTDSRFTDPS